MRHPAADNPAAHRELLARAEVLIRQLYGDPDLTLTDVAAELGVSNRQLQRVFSEVGETTFRKCLEEVRMKRARELLATGKYPSRRVAEHVGYRGGAAFRKGVQALPRVRALRVPTVARGTVRRGCGVPAVLPVRGGNAPCQESKRPMSGAGVECAKVAYEHLRLTRWPFPVVPDRDFCTFIADRKQLREDVDKLLGMLARQDASSIHLLWSWFGAGKTHTLFYMANRSAQTAKSMGGRLHAVYSEFPKSPKSFLDVFRAFSLGLDIDDLSDAYLEIWTSNESERVRREMLTASPDLATALQVLATGTDADQVLAMRWLQGESLPAGEFRKIGISQKIATSEEASRVLAAVVRLLSLAAHAQHRPACRVVWLLDEFQRIEQLRPAVRDEINTGLHSTFNSCPSGLSLVLSFSGKPEAEFPPWFSPELRDRIGRTRVIVLPPLRSDEALEFVRDVLAHFRTLEAHDSEQFFPFTEDACRYIIDEVAEAAELKPRAIMQHFDAVLRETESDIQVKDVELITPAIAKRVLAESVSLTAVADET